MQKGLFVLTTTTYNDLFSETVQKLRREVTKIDNQAEIRSLEKIAGGGIQMIVELPSHESTTPSQLFKEYEHRLATEQEIEEFEAVDQNPPGTVIYEFEPK